MAAILKSRKKGKVEGGGQEKRERFIDKERLRDC